MKYDKNKAIDIIVNAAQNYRKCLQDKVFLIIYQEKEITKTVQVMKSLIQMENKGTNM